MLVLSRKKNESLIIGDNIIVTVKEIRGNRITIGVTAPKEIPIRREEVIKNILTEQLPDSDLKIFEGPEGT